jgi:hypothetical protein
MVKLATIDKEKLIMVNTLENERAPTILEIRKADIEYVKLQIELAKLNKS